MANKAQYPFWILSFFLITKDWPKHLKAADPDGIQTAFMHRKQAPPFFRDERESLAHKSSVQGAL